MSWALARGNALTELVLTPSQKQARALNGPVKALHPKGQLVAHPVGRDNLYIAPLAKEMILEISVTG